MNLIDTNILIDYPQIVLNKDDVVILSSVLEELDSLAHSRDFSVRKKASRAIQTLLENQDKYTFLETGETFADKDLLLTAKPSEGVTIITNDRVLHIKGLDAGLNLEFYHEQENSYEGVTYLKTPEDNDKICEIFSPDFKCEYDNHYFVINDEDVTVYCWEKGRLRAIDRDSLVFYNDFSNRKIFPKNIEQIILMDMLRNKSITIMYVGGYFGTGKSFLTTTYAIEQLKKGKINKIVYVPNNSQTKDSMEIGTMPGDEYDKVRPYLGTLVDIIGELEVQSLYAKGELELMPISLARGRNLEKSIILVNEAQNLTEYHIKLLLGRVAEGSRIIFDGDLKQTDQKVFEDHSGLKLLTKLSESKEFRELFGTVTLKKTERSKTAEAAQYLDEL